MQSGGEFKDDATYLYPKTNGRGIKLYDSTGAEAATLIRDLSDFKIDSGTGANLRIQGRGGIIYFYAGANERGYMTSSEFNPSSNGVLSLGSSSKKWGKLWLNSFIGRSTTASITASTTQAQGQGALTTAINEVSVCANANDVITLPTAAAGHQIIVINNGAQTLQIFPASGDNLGAGVNASTTLAAAGKAMFTAWDATNWKQMI